MVDLHMHTKYSDGTDEVIELLKKAEEVGLEIISITDHNTVEVYKELENLNIKNYYSGKIIPGIEMNTKILGIPIEILGYGIDYKRMMDLLPTLYLPTEERNRIEAERLYEKCITAGIKLEENCLENYDANYFASKFIMKEIQKFEENKDIVDEEAWGELRVFYRKYMSNPQMPLYINTDDLVPNFEQTVDLIRECGGLVFIPHIFEYRENSCKILEYILKNYDIDGFECFYTTFTNEQTFEIYKICKENNLYVSGGSDYHGKAKVNVALGIGHGNLNIGFAEIEAWQDKVRYF